jgi:hypothetical protein
MPVSKMQVLETRHYGRNPTKHLTWSEAETRAKELGIDLAALVELVRETKHDQGVVVGEVSLWIFSGYEAPITPEDWRY